VFVVSDHGFGPTRVQFVVDEWLEKHNYLVKNSIAGIVSKLIQIVSKFAVLRRWIRSRVATTARSTYASLQENTIVWSQTKAFSGLKGENSCVSINLMGRSEMGIVAPSEYDSLVSEIIARLSEETIPGQPDKFLFKNIYRKEQIFRGLHTDVAPDIVLEPAENVSTAFNRNGHLYGPAFSQANHTREGILIAAGPQIRNGYRDGQSDLIDIAPTILYSLGLPVPENMDGSVILNLFDPEYVARNPVRDSKAEPAANNDITVNESGYTPEQQEEIERRLRDLGYL